MVEGLRDPAKEALYKSGVRATMRRWLVNSEGSRCLRVATKHN
jgi:hypothetical protein